MNYSELRGHPDLLEKERRRNREKERLARALGRRKKPSSKQTCQYGRTERAKNPQRYTAYKRVMSARRNGSLKPKPCEVCGSENSQAHHDDYTKPLDVRWFCRDHHWLLHRKMPETPIK